MWHYHCTPRGAVRPRELVNGNPRPCETEGPGPPNPSPSRPVPCPSGIKDITAGVPGPAAPPFPPESTDHTMPALRDRPGDNGRPGRAGSAFTSYPLTVQDKLLRSLH